MDHRAETKLEDAFRLFGEVSERLETSYRSLQERVAELTSELTAAQLRRDAERRERERLEDRLAELMVLLPAGVVVVGPAGEIREINPMAEDLLGGAAVGDAWQDRAPAAVAEVPPGNEECTLASGRTLAVSKRPLDPVSGPFPQDGLFVVFIAAGHHGFDTDVLLPGFLLNALD